MSTRHAWHRLGVHRYQCTRCGIERINLESPRPDGRIDYSASFQRDGRELARGKTPHCPGAPPPPSLSWVRAPGGGPWWDAPTGHRILAIRRGQAIAYMAYGPDRSKGWGYREWADGRAPHWSGQEPREHYARGETIPQPREYLGTADTAAEARDLCATHAAQLPREAAA